jgi:L-aminopeptidase/D-esterase-like protein
MPPITSLDSIVDVPGIAAGHAHDERTLTGCTVVLCPGRAVAGVDVRGAAPATRETDLCRPGTLVDRVDAVLLSGGSAFGLAAAGGVMRYLAERGHGFAGSVIPIPIVPAACLFDLGIGEVSWPDEAMGYAACTAARTVELRQGCAGAGMGATVGKLLGMQRATKSGIGSASMRVGGTTIGALVAVNAFGDVVLPRDGTIVAGARGDDGSSFIDTVAQMTAGAGVEVGPGTNTTIGVVATDAGLTTEQVAHLATAAHDGLALCIRPVHTMFDGDTVFALSTGEGAVTTRELAVLAVATVQVVARAIIRAVVLATPAGGLQSAALPSDLDIRTFS